MQRQDTFLTTGLAVFSGLISFIFVYYAVGVFTAAAVPEWDRVFAYVAAGYGLGNIYILSWAWRSSGAGPAWANRLIALCFFGVFVIDVWKTGGTAVRFLGLLPISGMLWLNWFAVKTIARRQR